MDQSLKRCPTCHQDLSIEEFATDRSAKDGRFYICRQCDKSKRDAKKRSIVILCQNCGQKREMLAINVKRAKAICRSCTKRMTAKRGPAHHSYKGTEHIPADLFGDWQRSAQERKKKFDVTMQDLEQMWVAQNGRCPVTGRALTLTVGDPNKVSLDRIDPDEHYVIGNVRLTTSMFNIVRNEYSDADLERILHDVEYIKALRNSHSGGNWWRRLKRDEYKRLFGTEPPRPSH